MSYQENCKVEGEVMTKFKIARMFFAGGKKQIEISKYLKCHKNTINGIIRVCKNKDSNEDIWNYLRNNQLHIAEEKLNKLFDFFKHESIAEFCYPPGGGR